MTNPENSPPEVPKIEKESEGRFLAIEARLDALESRKKYQREYMRKRRAK